MPLTGDGYLAGEYPGGTTTLEGQPVEADIRIAWRSANQADGDGRIVARTRSDASGEWRVIGLSLDELFDVIGSLEGYEDKIVSSVSPVPISFAYTQDSLYPNSAYNGMEGELTVIGGLPPYTFSLIDDLPEGMTANFDRRIVTLEGTTDLPDGAYYIRAEVTSSNNVYLEFEIPIYIGFNPPDDFTAEHAALHRPTHLKHGASGVWRPTWLEFKVNEDKDGNVFIKLSWKDVNGFGNGFRVYRSQQPIDPDNLPGPIATLAPAAGKPPQDLSWTDSDVIEGETYHYAVSTFFGDDEKITDEQVIIASPAPTEIGEFFQGGYYAGNIVVGGDTYAIMFAPEEADVLRQWKTVNNATEGTGSEVDGMANSVAMTETEALRLAHPAATYCRQYAGDGYDDWYLPSKNELALCWTYRAQLSELNMGMSATYVWSSTQPASSTHSAWFRRFTDGNESYNNKTSSYRVRPCRRLKLAI